MYLLKFNIQFSMHTIFMGSNYKLEVYDNSVSYTFILCIYSMLAKLPIALLKGEYIQTMYYTIIKLFHILQTLKNLIQFFSFITNFFTYNKKCQLIIFFLIYI